MNPLKIKVLNTYYLMRMLKDKTYQSVINWYYGDMKNVERIYKENETIYNHISKLCTKMTPIIDNIILGNACDASFYYHMKEANIGMIINVTKEIPNYFKKDFEYYKISLNDQNYENFTNEIFERVNTFISIYTSKNKGNVLIHCYMGSSRSATSFPVWIRRTGSFSIMSAITSTNSSDRSGANFRGCQGVCSQCRRHFDRESPPGNGTFPVTV